MICFSYAIRIFPDKLNNSSDTKRQDNRPPIKTMSFPVTCPPLNPFNQTDHQKRASEKEDE